METIDAMMAMGQVYANQMDFSPTAFVSQPSAQLLVPSAGIATMVQHPNLQEAQAAQNMQSAHCPRQRGLGATPSVQVQAPLTTSEASRAEIVRWLGPPGNAAPICESHFELRTVATATQRSDASVMAPDVHRDAESIKKMILDDKLLELRTKAVVFPAEMEQVGPYASSWPMARMAFYDGWNNT